MDLCHPGKRLGPAPWASVSCSVEWGSRARAQDPAGIRVSAGVTGHAEVRAQASCQLCSGRREQRRPRPALGTHLPEEGQTGTTSHFTSIIQVAGGSGRSEAPWSWGRGMERGVERPRSRAPREDGTVQGPEGAEKVAGVEGDDAGHCDACLGGTLKHLLDLWGWGGVWGVRGHRLEPGRDQSKQLGPARRQDHVSREGGRETRPGNGRGTQDRGQALRPASQNVPALPVGPETSCQELSRSPGPDDANPLAPTLSSNKTEHGAVCLWPLGPPPHS